MKQLRLIQNCILLFSLASIPALGQVIMTEVMYDLVGTDSPNEFIELYNLSPTDSTDLSGWIIKDKLASDALLDSGYGHILPPQSYALIFEGDYSFSDGLYADSIPAGTILLKVDDSSIGNGLSTADSLYLIDSSGTVVDSLGWTDIAPDGFSLEKVRLTYPNTAGNWEPSQDSLGTPGEINSILPLTIDGMLLADSLTATPQTASSNELVTLKGAVVNIGTQTISGEIIISSNGQDMENIDVSTLAELDTSDFETDLGPFSSGSHALAVRFDVSSDQDTSNNSGTVTVGVRFQENIVSINEFMPSPFSGLAEFVELIYHGSDSLNLENWRIADATESGNYTFPAFTIFTNEYVITAGDSSLISFVPDTALYIVPASGFPSLNNSGDEIRLFDPFGTLIDSLSYDSDWGYSSGVSAEKIFTDSSSKHGGNWKTSENINGMTPGFINSVTPKDIDGSILSDQISYAPIPPSPSDSITLSIPVRNSGLQTISGTVSVTKNNSELGMGSFSSLAKFDTSLVSVSIAPLVSGASILSFELAVSGDMDSTDNSATDTVEISFPFGTMQINEFMAQPNNDQTEFVEIVAYDTISLNGWSIADNTLNAQDLPDITVETGDYAVIAADSSIISFTPAGAVILIPTTGFPTLNNSGDAIYIMDLTATVVDSLIYTSDWPVESEKSTEKLRPEFESADVSNWSVSTESNGMTPGAGNSVTLFDTDGALLQDSISNHPQYPKPDETASLDVWIVNAGVNSFDGSISVEESDEELASANFTAVAFRETTSVSISLPELESGSHALVITLDVSGDENPGNDTAVDTILVSYSFGTVVINEFFSRPDSTQTEFIELYSIQNLDFTNWAFSDNSKSPKKIKSVQVTADEYFVVADEDSLIQTQAPSSVVLSVLDGFPALNNTADAIFLFDMTGFVVDSLIYSENWPIMETRSTEKLRPEFSSNDSSRWGVSVNDSGMTPGYKNSVYFEELPRAGTIVFEPNPFSPDGDSHEDLLYIKYKLPYETAIIKIEIFDVTGRSIATPYWNVYAAQEGIFSWDGKRKNGITARIGIYIVKTTARDAVSGNLWEDVQTVVLAKQL